MTSLAPGIAVDSQTQDSSAPPDSGWRALLGLGLRRGPERTEVAHRTGFGPLKVQRPFYPEGEVCHLYLLHPPGGIVGGDVLEVSVDLDEDAHALLTTPAAAKFYRSSARRAQQLQHLRVGSGAALEWLPQETILFDGAMARSVTRIDLAETARCMAWEILCLGRPAAGEVFNEGLFEQCLEVWRGGTPLLLERNRFEGGDAVLQAEWGLGGLPVTASMVCTPCDASDLAAARDALIRLQGVDRMSATLVDGLLLVRFLGLRADRARAHFIHVWEALRPRCLGATACRPRIWNT